MADRKDRMALLSRYDKLYLYHYEVKPEYNKWAEQWAADALIDSYGLDKCNELLSYYFDNAQRPDWKYFSNFVNDIIQSKIAREQDEKERKERREMAKRWLSE